MKKKTTKKNQSLNKGQFVKTMLNEIKIVSATVSPYQAFILIAVFDGFCKNELGFMLFKEQKINKAFAQMRNFYSPQMTLWLSHGKTKVKHMGKYKGLTVLKIEDTIKHIEKAINSKPFNKQTFLTIK